MKQRGLFQCFHCLEKTLCAIVEDMVVRQTDGVDSDCFQRFCNPRIAAEPESQTAHRRQGGGA